MKGFYLFLAGLALLGLSCGTADAQTTLFRDDFSGTTFDLGDWFVAGGTYQFNRAYFGNTPTVSDGYARLRLDTYDPSHPGTHFLGTNIFSAMQFSRVGLEFEARLRTNAMPSGVVSAFWLWGENPDGSADETDFEFLTSQINANPVPPGGGQPVVLTTWNDWEGDPAHYDDGIHHSSQTPVVPGLNLQEFNTFTIRWLPDRTEWLVNGELVRSTTEAIGDAPSPIRFNFWVPDENWPEAYNDALQPAASAESNESFFFDLDYVTVVTVPEPPAQVLGIVAAAVLLIAGPVARFRSARAGRSAPGVSGEVGPRLSIFRRAFSPGRTTGMMMLPPKRLETTDRFTSVPRWAISRTSRRKR